MEKIRVINSQTMKSYYGQEALRMINNKNQEENLLIDKFLGIDKSGNEIYERDILEDKQKNTFMVGKFFGGADISVKKLKEYRVISNQHKENLEKLF